MRPISTETTTVLHGAAGVLLIIVLFRVQVTEDDLAKYFGLLGEVNNVIMLRDKFTSRHKVRMYRSLHMCHSCSC